MGRVIELAPIKCMRRQLQFYSSQASGAFLVQGNLFWKVEHGPENVLDHWSLGGQVTDDATIGVQLDVSYMSTMQMNKSAGKGLCR